MKTVNIEEENLHIIWTTWVISMKFSGKKSQKTGLHPLSRKHIFRKTKGRVKLTPIQLVQAFLVLKRITGKS